MSAKKLYRPTRPPMESVTLNLPVIAVNVLVLVPLAKCWLNKLPGSVDLGPNVCTSLMVVQLRGTCQGFSREIWDVLFRKYKLSAKMMGLRASVAETDVVVVSGNGIVNGVLRGNGVDVRMVHPHPSPLPSRERGINRRALFFSGFPPGRGFAGMCVHPHPRGERGFKRRALFFSGFPPARE